MWRMCRLPAAACLLVLLFLVFVAYAGPLDIGQETQFGRQTWQSENGLPQNTVHAILQSNDGYIWVGTEGGLARFDGIRFAVYNAQSTPELKSNNIRALLDARDGALWIATADGIARLDKGRFSAFGTANGLPSGNVWSLFQDSSGTLWAVTAAGSARLSGNRFEPAPLSGSPSSTPSGTIVADSRRIASVAAIAGVPGRKITVSFEDRRGTIWVGTENGLTRILHGLLAPLRPDAAFAGETILAIAQDREGSLWVGTELNGLSILRAEKFQTFTSREGLPDDLVRCVFQDRRGVVWIGTDSHGLARYEAGKFTTIGTRDGLSSNVILALAEDADGALLVGTPDGLNRIRNGVISSITSADGLPDDFVRSIAASPDGSIWIGTRRGLAHLDNRRVIVYTTANGLGSDLIGAILPETANRLWIATLRGLTRFRDNTFTTYTTRSGLSSDIITALYRDPEGTLWIGAEGGGLNAFSAGHFIRFPASLGLPQVIYGIAEDPGQNLWMSSNAGMFCVSRKELLAWERHPAAVPAVMSYGTSDGLRINESSGGGHPAIWRAQDGSLWFATVKGVALLRPSGARLNSLPPPVVIESVSIDDQTVDPAHLLAIPPGHSRVSFEYAGLSFIAPQKIRFRYKLEGLDRDWVDAGTRRIAYYTNLPPRSYRFRVLARNNEGGWNESGASLAFRVEPRFYQTLWFDALALVAFALLAWSVYRWRVKQVEARFSAVLQERNRIAREIHDTLAQGFAGISLQLELVSRLLASSTDAAREHLDEARLLVRTSLSEARRSIWDLRSHSEENRDLAARISKIAQQLASPGHAKVKLHVRGAYRPLSPKVEDELLKIAQEAVTNAVRHADADHIDIELAFEARKMRMTIADDGQGFTHQPNASGPDGHFGLRGMRERAEAIDADLKLQSSAGKGTTVCVETSVS